MRCRQSKSYAEKDRYQMNRNLFTTDEFGRSVDQGSKRYDTIKAMTRRPRVSPYKKYFEGYSAVFVPKRSGVGQKAVRVYEGALYHQELTPRQRLGRRLLYAVMFLFAVALFILAMVIPTASNSTWYVVITTLVPAYFYARLLLALNLYISSGNELKTHEYKDGALKLTEVTRHIDKAVLVPMIASGVLFIMDPGAYSTSELLRFLLFVVSAAAAKMIGKLEGKVEYTEIPPVDIDS